jgi:hypothetical protein
MPLSHIGWRGFCLRIIAFLEFVELLDYVVDESNAFVYVFPSFLDKEVNKLSINF